MKKFLISEFGTEKGKFYYSLQQAKEQELIKQITDKSKNQMKTIAKNIIPKIALYKIMEEQLNDKEKAYSIVGKYIAVLAEAGFKKYAALEIVPFYYSAFKYCMRKVISGNDNWETDFIRNDSEVFAFNIKKCLWYDTFSFFECPELCRQSCDYDHLVYDNLKRVRFVRKGTLAKGSACCDFCFYNTSKQNKQ